MDRTVPTTGSEEIELYMRTYYSLLRSTHTIQLETLVEVHQAMDSSLHVHAREATPDVPALSYALQRLPDCIADVDYVVLGQLEKSFISAGIPVHDWRRVYASGRRRRIHYDDAHTLAVFIASRSDIDDLIPMLTALQIEWNKLHDLLQNEVVRLFLAQHNARTTELSESERTMLATALHIDADDLRRLEIVLSGRFVSTLSKMAAARKQIGIKQIAGSFADYRRASAYWWQDVIDELGRAGVALEDRPVYFISSNTFSILNLITGFALREEAQLVEYMAQPGREPLYEQYQRMQRDNGGRHKANFLYYVLRAYLAENANDCRQRFLNSLQDLGIRRIPSKHGSDIETQVIELNRLRAEWLDPRTDDMISELGHLGSQAGMARLHASDAVIVNVDYPLGLGAYEILSRVTERIPHLLGIYIMGKAATLNGRIGDVMLPNVVHDEHSQNTYLFNNCFSAHDVAPHMAYGMVLDNQKAISTPGTFLQNAAYMDVFYREGYTIIEMEAGPYLSAVYEAVRPRRFPQNEIVTLHFAPFDIGFLHYASDTPFTKGKNLGAGSLDFKGIAPTYATSIAILQRIFQREVERMRASESAPHSSAMSEMTMRYPARQQHNGAQAIAQPHVASEG
jgi:hypothetical protein